MQSDQAHQPATVGSVPRLPQDATLSVPLLHGAGHTSLQATRNGAVSEMIAWILTMVLTTRKTLRPRLGDTTVRTPKQSLLAVRTNEKIFSRPGPSAVMAAAPLAGVGAAILSACWVFRRGTWSWVFGGCKCDGRDLVRRRPSPLRANTTALSDLVRGFPSLSGRLRDPSRVGVKALCLSKAVLGFCWCSRAGEAQQ